MVNRLSPTAVSKQRRRWSPIAIPDITTSLPHMSRKPTVQQSIRGPGYELHRAAFHGSVEGTTALLSRGSIDINACAPSGTPLTIAALEGHSRVVRLLLKMGADVSVMSSAGMFALLGAAAAGHVAVTKMLVQAGADLETTTSHGGATALVAAAAEGHSEVVRVLIKAGASINSRTVEGETPLSVAAEKGQVSVVRELLRAKADPLLGPTDFEGEVFLPLNAAAENGHLDIVRDLIQEVGIAGCGGASGGVSALKHAAHGQHLDVLVVLTDAGVVDTGSALLEAVKSAHKPCVKFLLQQQQGKPGEAAYANMDTSVYGVQILLVHLCLPSCCPRLMRLLIDAGANTASAMPIKMTAGGTVHNFTPLDFVEISVRDKVVFDKPATEEQVHKLEAMHRLLLQVDAVHATSWLWHCDVSTTSGVSKAVERTRAASRQLAMVLPIISRRAKRRSVLSAALCRFSSK